MLNSTCKDVFSSPQLDRWVASHTLYPFSLVYLFNLPMAHVLLLCYVWETLEIAIVDMCIRQKASEPVVNSLLLDPLAGFLGASIAVLMIWILGEPPTDYWSKISKNWHVVLLACFMVTPGALIPWYVENHKLAIGVFGIYWAIVLIPWMALTKPQDAKFTWLPAVYLLVLTLALTFSEKLNTHLTNLALHAALFVVLLAWRVCLTNDMAERKQ